MAKNVQIEPVEVIWPLICYEAVSASVTLEILLNGQKMYKKNLLKLYDPKYDIKQSVQLWLMIYS